MYKYQEIEAQSLLYTLWEKKQWLKGSFFKAMFANDERMINGSYAIYCIISGQDKGEIEIVKALIPKNAPLEYPSLSGDIPAASWYEREILDLFGIKPIGHPDPRPLVLHENWPRGVYPMRKDFALQEVPESDKEYPIPEVDGEGVFEVPVGPIHAGIIEPGHFRFSQAGENVINLEAKLFFTHRGIEKAIEGTDAEQGIFTAERICGACSVSHALSYSQAVECSAGCQVPLRAEFIRALAAELERLYNHVGDIGNLCAGVGFAAGVSLGSRLKEYLMRLNEIVTGNRFLRGLVVPGGAKFDISTEISREILRVLYQVNREFKELVSLLKNNDAFLDRVNNTGILPMEAAQQFEVVGVAARASGLRTDVRKDYPYSVYPRLDFKVPVYTSGDVAARLWVRVDEVFNSINIIEQVLNEIPEGEYKAEIPEIKPFSMGIGMSESARGSNLHFLMIGKNNEIYRCFVRSASYSNWPAVPLAVPGNIIPDFPLINKSFELCYACLDR